MATVPFYRVQLRCKDTSEDWRDLSGDYKKEHGGSTAHSFHYERDARAYAESFYEEWNNTYHVRVITQTGRLVWQGGGAPELPRISYHIEVHSTREGWRKTRNAWTVYGFGRHWRTGDTYTLYDDALRCAKAIVLEESSFGNQVRIVNENGTVVWSGETWHPDNTQTPQEEKNMAAPLNNPLTIPRADLLAKLQENLAAEVKKRQDAEQARADERAETLAAIAKFTPDELYNIFAANYTVEVKDLTFDQDEKSWVTQDVKPTPRETDLEKFTRILAMASDESIEVTPTEPLYDLL